MKMGDIMREKQPEILTKLKKPVPQKKISKSDIRDCMRHDAYRRSRGAVKQVRW